MAVAMRRPAMATLRLEPQQIWVTEMGTASTVLARVGGPRS
jgi:hypothetical protein